MSVAEKHESIKPVHLATLIEADLPELLDCIERSRALHEPWVFLPSTAGELRRYLARPPETNLAYGVREAEGRLVGVVNVSSVIRGPFQNAFLSYYVFSPFERQGYMRAGMRLAIDRAFGREGLHRLEANIQPGNVASAALVRSLGFRLEGHSPRYLKIGDEWRDHDRYALTAEEWPDSA